MNRILRLSAMFALAGLALTAAPKADAAFVPPGSQGFADLGAPQLIGSTDINAATGFQFGAPIQTTGAKTGGFGVLPTGTIVTVTNFTPTNGTTFQIDGNAAFGTFQGISVVETSATTGTRSFEITGTFTGGTAFGTPGPAFPATVSLSFTQAGGPGGAITDSFSLNVAAVPEPASIALVGLGLAGVAGFSARRRSAK